MGSRIITREARLAAAGTFAAPIYGGPCELLGLAVNYGASASGSVLTLKEKDANGLTKYVITTDTDFGTTVPVRIFHDAKIIAGTATAGVGLNVSFFEGIYVSVTGDSSSTTGTVVTAWIRPLIIKKVALHGVTAAATLFQGAGRLKGVRVDYTADMAAGADLQITDGVIGPDGLVAGNNLTVYTDVVTDFAAVNQQVATTTGHDEAGSAVTTAATGAYANDGVLFATGVSAGLAQGTANAAAIIEVLIES